MEAGLVSIIMPVLNGEQYIREAIQSVLAQSYPQWELVVVDDGSFDGTSKVVRSFQDSRIRYTYQENRGQAAALNTGLDLAKGEFITTLDYDDVFPVDSYPIVSPTCPNTLNLAWFMAMACIATSRVSRYSSSPNTCHPVWMEMSSSLDLSRLFMAPEQRLSSAGKSSSNIRFGMTIDCMVPDWDFYIRLAEKTQFGFVPSVVIHYRLHDASMTMAMPSGRR